MDDDWTPGPPTPRADMEAIKLLARGYSVPFDEMLRRKQAEMVDALHRMQDKVAQQVIDAGIDPADVEIVTEQVSALDDPVIVYTVTARWKATSEPI